jgi:ketosteroid isomerase-like protein
MAGRLIERVVAYLRAIEHGDLEAVLASYAPDAVQVEWPNRLKSQGAERGLRQVASDFERGKALLASQSYEIVRTLEGEGYAVVEMIWKGRLAVSMGHLAAGTEMVAHSAVAFDFDGDRIRAQRNYDCFDPF